MLLFIFIDLLYNKYMEMFEKIVTECNAALYKINDLHQCNLLKSQFLGNNSDIKKLLSSLTDKTIEEKRTIGPQIHKLKSVIEKLFKYKIQQLLSKKEIVDLTLQIDTNYGYFHPITIVQQQIISLLMSMGLKFEQSPEIETEWQNFTAVNVPENHPCREDHQSFFLNNGKMLRTHTSSIQSYILKSYSNTEDYGIFTVGRTYRRDLDRTHVPMFHQIEGFIVNEYKSSVKDMINFIQLFLNSFFEKKVQIRIRPSFFPFTEPSLEIDALLNNKWLEILGCGIIHPNVFNISTVKVRQGFAFGCGLERLTMLKYNITDLRKFYSNDYRNIQNFNFQNMAFAKDITAY